MRAEAGGREIGSQNLKRRREVRDRQTLSVRRQEQEQVEEKTRQAMQEDQVPASEVQRVHLHHEENLQKTQSHLGKQRFFLLGIQEQEVFQAGQNHWQDEDEAGIDCRWGAFQVQEAKKDPV